MNYKEREKQLANILHLATGKQVWLAPNEYSPYDAFTDNAILEFKIRSTYYENKMIEQIKMEENIKQAKRQNKSFLYVVWDEKGIHVLDVIRNYDAIFATGLKQMNCPTTTAFENNEKKMKNVYNVPQQMFVTIAEDENK